MFCLSSDSQYDMVTILHLSIREPCKSEWFAKFLPRSSETGCREEIPFYRWGKEAWLFTFSGFSRFKGNQQQNGTFFFNIKSVMTTAGLHNTVMSCLFIYHSCFLISKLCIFSHCLKCHPHIYLEKRLTALESVTCCTYM